MCNAANEQGCRDSNTVLVSGTLDNAVGYIKASNTDKFDGFGESVNISADGNTLAVGVSGERSTATGVNGDQDDSSNYGTVAVYVFARINRIWQQQAYLKADRNTFRNRFGEALGLKEGRSRRFDVTKLYMQMSLFMVTLAEEGCR